jgi:hypothetical protein
MDLPVFFRGEEHRLDGDLTQGEAIAIFESAGLRLRCDLESNLQVEPCGAERG